MRQPILSVTGLCKSFGALKATDRLDLDVAEGQLHAIIGPNGAGKSTLMKQLSGEMSPDSGHIAYDGQDITNMPAAQRARHGVARSYQITSVFPEYSTLDNVVMAVQTRVTHGFSFLRRSRGVKALEEPARAILDDVGLGDEVDKPASALAHGQQRQLEIAMALALEPKLLLLDEPMAGMGRRESAKVIDILLSLKQRMTIVLVEHDMDAVFALADRITVLVYGQAIATGTAAEVGADPAVREAYLGETTDVA